MLLAVQKEEYNCHTPRRIFPRSIFIWPLQLGLYKIRIKFGSINVLTTTYQYLQATQFALRLKPALVVRIRQTEPEELMTEKKGIVVYWNID